MELDFKILTMMDLRSSPGEILNRVYEKGEAFIIEKSGNQKACLVPIWHFFPDIPKEKVNKELNELREKGEDSSLSLSTEKELEISFKGLSGKDEPTIKIVLPHGYPNKAPRVYADLILDKPPHRWHDGALCIFGAVANWNPGKHNIVFALDLARKWVFNYKKWRKNGKWPKQEGDNNEQ